MRTNLFQPYAIDLNLYLKIGNQLLGPVTKHEAVQLQKQEIVLNKDLVAKNKEGPWVEIGESSTNLEMLFPLPDANPPPLPGDLYKEVVKSPLPKNVPPLPPANPPASAVNYIAPGWLRRRPLQASPPVSGPLSIPEIKNITTPKSVAPGAFKGLAKSLLFALLLITCLVGISVFAIATLIKLIDSRNYSFPNKLYPKDWKIPKEWKNDLFYLLKSDSYFRSIDVWDKKNIFISTGNSIHRWDSNGWKSLRPIQDDWDLSKIKAIGPKQVIAVKIKDNDANWIICSPPNEPPESFFFKADNLKPYELRETKPLVGKNGEYIFPGVGGRYYFNGKNTEFKQEEEAAYNKISVSDPNFAKFIIDVSALHSKDSHKILFSDKNQGICAFSIDSSNLVIEQKDRKPSNYKMVGNRKGAWKGWARSATDFWVMCQDGIVLRSDGAQLKKITNPLPNSDEFVDVNWDNKTGIVYGITRDQIWVLDE